MHQVTGNFEDEQLAKVAVYVLRELSQSNQRQKEIDRLHKVNSELARKLANALTTLGLEGYEGEEVFDNWRYRNHRAESVFDLYRLVARLRKNDLEEVKRLKAGAPDLELEALRERVKHQHAAISNVRKALGDVPN